MAKSKTIDFPVANRFSGEVQFVAKIEADESSTIGLKLRLAVLWAIKEKTDLTSANLRSANLRYADLRYADLTSADLRYADLRYADLTSANLRYAKNLGDFTMTDGLKFSQYLSDVVPALLTAGGKTMAEIEASRCWECHSWDNCPMHVAFGIRNPSEGPPLLRARIAEFVQFFDARIIPAPWGSVPAPADQAS